MNKLVKLTMLIVFAATVCCSKTVDTLEGRPITIKGEIAPITKAVESGFEENDEFSAYIAESAAFDSNMKHKNLKYTKKSIGWSATSPIYWKDSNQNIWIWGIYPYQSTVVSSPLTFTVQADQSRRESETKLSGYELSDLLLAYNPNVAPTEVEIPLTFTHALSKIYVELEGTFDLSSGVVVKIGNVKLSSSIDLSTKTVTATTGSEGVVTASPAGGAFFKAIVQPSVVTNLTFSIEVGGRLYQKTIDSKTFVAGKQHNFKLTLKNGVIDILNGTIFDWGNGGNTDDDVNPF